MDQEITVLSDIKSDKERQTSYDITCMMNLKNDTNKLIYKTKEILTDTDFEAILPNHIKTYFLMISNLFIS